MSERSFCQGFVFPSGAISGGYEEGQASGMSSCLHSIWSVAYCRAQIRSRSAAQLCENRTSVIIHCSLYAVRTRAHAMPNCTKTVKAWACRTYVSPGTRSSGGAELCENENRTSVGIPCCMYFARSRTQAVPDCVRHKRCPTVRKSAERGHTLLLVS